jgi:hypothetical protein
MNDDNLCTSEETIARVGICLACVNFVVREDFTTYCNIAQRDISLLAANKDQTCPLENW